LSEKYRTSITPFFLMSFSRKVCERKHAATCLLKLWFLSFIRMTGWYYACVRIQVQFAATFSSEVENENYLLNYIYMLSYQIFILADEVNEKKIFF